MLMCSNHCSWNGVLKCMSNCGRYQRLYDVCQLNVHTCQAGRLAVRHCPPVGQQPAKLTKASYTQLRRFLLHNRYSDSLSASVSVAQ